MPVAYSVSTVFAGLLLVSLASACSQPGGRADEVSEHESPVSEELVAAGRSQFLHCNSCHSMDPADEGLEGPHLQGIVGRRAAAVEGFAYTEVALGLDFSCDRARLDRWLEDPMAMVPDMCAPFRGISSASQRKALIAFLENPPM